VSAARSSFWPGGAAGTVLRIVASRLVQAVLTALVLASLCFAFVQALPGDAALRIATARSGDDRVTAESVARIRAQEGLDRPVLAQYASWIGRLARGDLGHSLVSRQPVWRELAEHGRFTLGLGALGWLLSYAIALPLGNFDDSKVVNAGRNTYAVEPSAAVTYFDPKSGWDISLAGTYVITYENEATDYNSGDLVQFDWAIGKQLSKQFKIGLVGYGMIQVTDDSGDGAVLGRFRSEVFSVGAAASYNFMLGKQPMALSARYYHEFGVKNTFEGSAFFVGLSTKL
jgi:hypothetical protein